MADSPFPFTSGDRIEYRGDAADAWHPGLVTDVFVRVRDVARETVYVVSLDGWDRELTVTDARRLRLVTPAGFGD